MMTGSVNAAIASRAPGIVSEHPGVQRVVEMRPGRVIGLANLDERIDRILTPIALTGLVGVTSAVLAARTGLVPRIRGELPQPAEMCRAASGNVVPEVRAVVPDVDEGEIEGLEGKGSYPSSCC